MSLFRPERRARRRPVQGEIVGMLPEEELALRRALLASLQGEKKSPQKSNDARSSKSEQDTPGHSTLSLNLPQQPNPTSSESDSALPITPLKLEPSFRDYSPFSSHGSSPTSLRQLSFSSSPIGSPGSIGSSLRLVISTSSWSSSDSSSSWCSRSVSPVPPHKRGKRPKGDAPSKKGKGKGKLTVDSSLFSEVSPAKGKTPPKMTNSPKTPKSLGKKLKKPKQGPKIKKSPKSTKALPKLSAGAGCSSTKATGKQRKRKLQKGKKSDFSSVDEWVLSPEAALVLHDHCYFSGADMLSSGTEAAMPGDCMNDSLSPTNSCTYQAQRKFAQNHISSLSQRHLSDETENLANPKEIPKTEDFLTFLCLRGSSNVPENLRKFNAPWTPLKKRLVSKNGQKISVRCRITPGNNGKASRSRSSIAKRLDFTASGEAVQVQH